MNLIEKWTEKHSELLRFYSTENLTERERNLLRTQMKDYLEMVEDLQANEPESSKKRVEVCRGRYKHVGNCVKYGGECTKEDCDYWQT